MNKLIYACAVLAAYRLATPLKAHAWFSKTHEDITSKALDLLKKDGRSKESEFYEPYREQILAGCTKPDRKGDPDKGGGMHYYSICTPKGAELQQTAGYYRNRRGKLSKSARTMLEENYTSALCLYKSGMIPQAMDVLARAAHFIEDMSCTVHVSNIMYMDSKRNVHNAYEQNTNKICTKYTADRFDKKLLKAYEGDSFAEAAHKLIKSSSKYVELISTLEPAALEEAASNMLPTAQQNVMALLLKFYKDCFSEKGNYICEGGSYTIKNAASGLVLTMNGNSLTLDKPDKDKAQRFSVSLSDLGAVKFTTENGRTANKRLNGTEKKSDPAQFRLAALGNKKFRIMTGSSSFAKAVGCSFSNRIAVSPFDPADPTQIWIITRS